MTYSEMQNQVLLLLGVSSITNSGVTTTEVQSCINRALPEVGANVEDLLTYCAYTCIVGTQTYSISQHYLTVKQLILQANTDRWERLTYCNLEEWERVTYGMSTHRGEPEYYKIERWATSTVNDPQIPGDIWLWPIPDDDYPFRLYYYQRPTTLTNAGDISELPIHWHMLPCYKAAEWLAIKKKDYELARMLERKYAIGLQDARSNALGAQRDRASFACDLMGYGDIE